VAKNISKAAYIRSNTSEVVVGLCFQAVSISQWEPRVPGLEGQLLLGGRHPAQAACKGRNQIRSQLLHRSQFSALLAIADLTEAVAAALGRQAGQQMRQPTLTARACVVTLVIGELNSADQCCAGMPSSNQLQIRASTSLSKQSFAAVSVPSHVLADTHPLCDGLRSCRPSLCLIVA
jgi:hypothetical protein